MRDEKVKADSFRIFLLIFTEVIMPEEQDITLENPTEEGKSLEVDAVKIGNRHSRADSDAIQQIHDQAIFLGAQSPPVPVQSEIISFPLGNYDGKAIPNALKAISQTDDELRVGNYILLFGDERQKRTYLPPLTRGEMITGIAISPSSSYGCAVSA